MLSKYERETIIVFNEEEPNATITTCNERLRRRLLKFSKESNDCCLLENRDGYARYTVPKNWVKVNMPRQYSEEQRELMAERARNNLNKKK